MGRVLRVTLSLPSDVAAFVGDPTNPPALCGALLAEVLTASTCWHVGAPYPAEAAVAVGVVLLVRDRDAQRLLDAAPDAQGDILRRALWLGGWLFVGTEAAPTLWPPVAVQAVTLDAMRAAEDSRDEWAGMAAPPASARFDVRRLAVN